MTSLIPCLKFNVNLYCDAVFSRIHLLFVDASTRSNSKLSLRVTQHYIRRRFWGNDSTPNMFSSFYSLAYIRKSDTFKRKFPSFSCSYKSKPMSHLYFHRIERGVEYFTFFGSTSFHISGCRWKYLPTQCFMPHITVSPARYLVQHHCNLVCNIVFSRIHLVILNGSMWLNT